MSRKSFRKGVFTPAHPEKYDGDVSAITYRSSWELRFARWLDHNTKVIRWSSEEIIIPYVSPLDGRVHRYYPDFFVEYINIHGEVKREVIEIKPKNQATPPKATRGKSRKSLLMEQQTYDVNQAKWAAAIRWCDQRSYTFRVFTEDSLFR